MGCRPSRSSRMRVADSTCEYNRCIAQDMERLQCKHKKSGRRGRKKAPTYNTFSSTTRIYDKRSGMSKITVRLSTDGSILQVERYEVDFEPAYIATSVDESDIYKRLSVCAQKSNPTQLRRLSEPVLKTCSVNAHQVNHGGAWIDSACSGILKQNAEKGVQIDSSISTFNSQRLRDNFATFDIKGGNAHELLDSEGRLDDYSNTGILLCAACNRYEKTLIGTGNTKASRMLTNGTMALQESTNFSQSSVKSVNTISHADFKQKLLSHVQVPVSVESINPCICCEAYQTDTINSSVERLPCKCINTNHISKGLKTTASDPYKIKCLCRCKDCLISPEFSILEFTHMSAQFTESCKPKCGISHSQLTEQWTSSNSLSSTNSICVIGVQSENCHQHRYNDINNDMISSRILITTPGQFLNVDFPNRECSCQEVFCGQTCEQFQASASFPIGETLALQTSDKSIVFIDTGHYINSSRPFDEDMNDDAENGIVDGMIVDKPIVRICATEPKDTPETKCCGENLTSGTKITTSTTIQPPKDLSENEDVYFETCNCIPCNNSKRKDMSMEFVKSAVENEGETCVEIYCGQCEFCERSNEDVYVDALESIVH